MTSLPMTLRSSCTSFINAFTIRQFTRCQNMSSTTEKPMESAITSKIHKSLNPSYLKVINESYMHNVPRGAETHFKVVIVSDQFKDLPLLKRHRRVNDILKAELQGGVHALSIIAKTPDQWSGEEIEPSPNCRGGFGK